MILSELPKWIVLPATFLAMVPIYRVATVNNYLMPAFKGHPGLFALEHIGFHKTPAVLDLLRRHHVIPSLIPAGCTSLLQLLDISINNITKKGFTSCVSHFDSCMIAGRITREPYTSHTL